MSIFEYMPEELLGTVESVDTSTVIVKVKNDDKPWITSKPPDLHSEFKNWAAFNWSSV